MDETDILRDKTKCEKSTLITVLCTSVLPAVNHPQGNYSL